MVTEGSSGESEGLLARLTAGSRVAGYRLEEQIGAGGMAVVFRARDERLGRVVALKVLAPALAVDPAFRRRFIAESRAATAVDDPHIIPVYAAGEASGDTFLWDVRTHRRLKMLAAPEGLGAGPAVVQPDGRLLAVAGGVGQTYLWDVATGKRLATLTDPDHQRLLSDEFSPVGLTVATCDTRGRVLLWRISERQVRG